MEKGKKYTKSSYKGRIGSGYSVDARSFKTAEQRKKVKENLEIPEGLIRLLKNSNPVCWLLVMGEVMNAQPDARYLGYNPILHKTPELEVSLKHRIIHLLKMEKSRWYDKLFAVEVASTCSLYHPKFLSDYIVFYRELNAYLIDEPFPKGKEKHPVIKNMDYNSLSNRAIDLLYIIGKILDNWDRQFEYPAELINFFDFISVSLKEYENFPLTGQYKNRLLSIAVLLWEIDYHDKRTDKKEHDESLKNILPQNQTIQKITADIGQLINSIKNFEEKDNTRNMDDAFFQLKENLLVELCPVFRIFVSLHLYVRFDKEKVKGLYQEHKQELIKVCDLACSYNYHDINYNSCSYWNIHNNLNDYYLFSFISKIAQLGKELYWELKEFEKTDNP